MSRDNGIRGTEVILLKRLFREPLLHFFALALIIFAVYDVFGSTTGGRPDSIVVTVSRIERIAAVFALTWQRPPSTEELKALIDDYVKEEIYEREALALGLDKDDAVIRRRLRQKMEFINESGVDAVAPTDADLEAYLVSHPDEFEIDPLLAFQQVFLSRQRHGDQIDRDADSVRETLRANPSADMAEFGDGSLLPSELPLTNKASISQTFGPEFAEAINNVSPGEWTGPIKSGFGVHIVRVLKRQAGRLPALGEIRDAVMREWSNANRQKLDDAKFNELLKRYRVTIESLPVTGVPK
jgi:PPIC-type PPIASE domain